MSAARTEIERLRALLADEQWHVSRDDGDGGYITHRIDDGCGTQIARVEEGTYPDGELLRARRDAALIVAAHNALPALLTIAHEADAPDVWFGHTPACAVNAWYVRPLPDGTLPDCDYADCDCAKGRLRAALDALGKDGAR